MSDWWIIKHWREMSNGWRGIWESQSCFGRNFKVKNERKTAHILSSKWRILLPNELWQNGKEEPPNLGQEHIPIMCLGWCIPSIILFYHIPLLSLPLQKFHALWLGITEEIYHEKSWNKEKVHSFYFSFTKVFEELSNFAIRFLLIDP